MTPSVAVIDMRKLSPEQRDRVARMATNMTLQGYIDAGAKCAQCGRPYESVGSVYERGMIVGASRPPGEFPYWDLVEKACWPEYAKTHPKPEARQ